MASPEQYRIWIFSLPAATAALAVAFMLIVAAPQSAQAQTFNVLHTFTGGQDGGEPYAGLTMDAAGNLYGTAAEGGSGRCNGGGYACGTVYRLKRSGSGWIFSPLYAFTGGSDGSYPDARVIFGPNGTLYGTTNAGGGDFGGYCYPLGCGTVFNLRPSPAACKAVLCPWTETVLYRFTNGGVDGANPGNGALTFDQAGNIYGTTVFGGNYDGGDGYGVVYELTPSGTESVVYAFSGSDGYYPDGGVIFDNAGNLYGTTEDGGLNMLGTVFELTYSIGFGWAESFLYSFRGGSDGSQPTAGLIFDQSGNLYGAASGGGKNGCGTVFKLTSSNGGWTLNTIYGFAGSDGCEPRGTLVMDGAGNLYGTTASGGTHKAGTVFKLTPSGDNWIYTDLHDFCSYQNCSDGENPQSNVVIDAKGNLYGTAFDGGSPTLCSNGCGTVWEITP